MAIPDGGLNDAQETSEYDIAVTRCGGRRAYCRTVCGAIGSFYVGDRTLRSRRPTLIRDAGQHEFLNWICLAGAMDDRKAEILAWAECYIFNSSKCVCLFRRN